MRNIPRRRRNFRAPDDWLRRGLCDLDTKRRRPTFSLRDAPKRERASTHFSRSRIVNRRAIAPSAAPCRRRARLAGFADARSKFADAGMGANSCSPFDIGVHPAPPCNISASRREMEPEPVPSVSCVLPSETFEDLLLSRRRDPSPWSAHSARSAVRLRSRRTRIVFLPELIAFEGVEQDLARRAGS